MRVFVDTSALYALLDEDDLHHTQAVEILARLQGSQLVTHAYAQVEALSLVSKRFGWRGAERLLNTWFSVVEVEMVDSAVHQVALATFREAASTRFSIVDRTSFAFMQANRLDTAFAFDPDFESAGFSLLG